MNTKGLPDNRHLGARSPDEFSVTTGAPPVKAPALCPRCSSPANKSTDILTHNYQPEAGYGILAQVFRFLLIGSSSSTLLTVVTCERCHRSSNLFKGLEWVCRALAIILTAVLLVTNSTPELPLIKRGAGLILLSLSPLVIGAILVLEFRNLTDHRKGITYVRSDGKIKWLRVQSAEWLREFTRLQEISLKDELEIEQDERVVNFYQTSLTAWSNGELASLHKGFKTDADAMQLADFIKKHPPYEGSSLRVFFKDFQPLEGEFLVGLGENWFVLTNLRLIQRDGRNNEFKEVTLADVDTYEIKQKKTVTLVFKMKSGQEILFEETQGFPLHKFISGLISQSIVA